MTRMPWISAALCALACCLPVDAPAQGAKASSPVELAREADRLAPGQWVWAPQIAPQGPLLIYVDLSRQLATVYRNGVRIGVSTVSTGKPGHETPTGVFTILQKDAKHRSSTYHNAPMPFQQRLTWDGVALHAGGLPGYPESHGCVHLPYAFAKVLFEATEHATTVIIAGNAAHPVDTSRGDVLAPVAGDTPDGEFWAPERAPSGPVTMVMSRSDQAMLVLRNGIEIGRSSATIASSDEATHVLTLTVDENGAQSWVFAGVSGHSDEDGRIVDEITRNRVHVPQGFHDKVSAILRPGSTLLVTQAPLTAGDVGAGLTVMSGMR